LTIATGCGGFQVPGTTSVVEPSPVDPCVVSVVVVVCSALVVPALVVPALVVESGSPVVDVDPDPEVSEVVFAVFPDPWASNEHAMSSVAPHADRHIGRTTTGYRASPRSHHADHPSGLHVTL
jgi:hypothetical protein